MNASTRLELRVVPGARRPGIVGRQGGSWNVRVTAAPEGGRANAAVIRLLADALELPRGNVEVIAGHTMRDKVVAIAGISSGEAEERMALSAGVAR